MKNNFTIKLKCESKELMESMMDVMLMSKGQLANHLTQALSAKGFESDVKILVQGNELTITQKSGDKGTVFVTAGLSINTVKYSELVAPCKYLIIKDGSVTLYIKRENGVDLAIARYPDLDEALAGVNSNDIETAYNNIINPKVAEEAAPVMDVSSN